MHDLLTSAKASARSLVTLRPALAEYEEEIIFAVLHAHYAAQPPIVQPSLSPPVLTETPTANIVAITELPDPITPTPTPALTKSNRAGISEDNIDGWIAALNDGTVTFRQAPRQTRLDIFARTAQRISIILDPEQALSQPLWDRMRPKWAPSGSSLVTTFQIAWPKLVNDALGIAGETQGQPEETPPPIAEFSRENQSEEPPRHRRSLEEVRNQIPFSEFDTLARREVKRLSTAGTLCGPLLWNAARDVRLPDWIGLLQRYECTDSTQLASRLGYAPPLGLAA